MLSQPLEKLLHTTKNHLKKLNDLGMKTGEDLVKFFPRALEDAAIKSNLSDLIAGEKNTVTGTLQYLKTETTRNRKKITRGQLVLDDGASLEVVWFRLPYALKNLQTPAKVYLLGTVKKQFGSWQLLNPEVHTQAGLHVGGIRPVYPESPPITSKWLREKICPLLKLAADLPEIIPEKVRKKYDLTDISTAINDIHFPKTADDWLRAKKRLGFEEIFAIQIRVMSAKLARQAQSENPYQVPPDSVQLEKDLACLPFKLTTDQKNALTEIYAGFNQDHPMSRLLQGDVGCGKTVVSFLAALPLLRAGFQVAILAPTEILTGQHLASARKFFQALAAQDQLPELQDQNLLGENELSHLACLTGSVKESAKKSIRENLRTGKIRLVIGTHAILTESTVFKNLGLAIIDEQHRFGVEQRATLTASLTHQLSMTATPIPRSLALTVYGDQDLSIIREKPAGRKPITTRIISDEKTANLCYQFIDDQVEKGRQIFWVCPLVDASDKIEAKDVAAHYELISQRIFPKRRVQFLHGKMKPRDKEAVMSAFKNHEFDIMVSTSVIEVGVDIPSATVMCIENSERFGLSQLHQFRGRIGRNDLGCYCFLFTGKGEDKHRSRLQAMERSQNGFELSEIDLKLRGAGEIYGLRQSGLPDLKCADLNDHSTMQAARTAAQAVLEFDLELNLFPALKKAIKEREVYLSG